MFRIGRPLRTTLWSLAACAGGVALLFGWESRSAALDDKVLRNAERAYCAKAALVSNPHYLTVVDYRKSIAQRRLFVYDRVAKRVVLTSRTSHAFRSGLLYATAFSNVEGTEQSCTGSFVTLQPYYGKYGFSLRVKGVSPENSNAAKRALVFHSGALWSRGCWTTDRDTNERLIHLIQNGTFVFVAK